MILETTHVIAVPDLARAADFYRDTLGFEVAEIGDPGWRLFVKDSCRILAGECPDAIAPRDLGDHSYFAYFVVQRVDDYYARVRSRGVEILKPLRDESWGMREFGLRTAHGHRIMIGSRIAPNPAFRDVAAP